MNIGLNKKLKGFATKEMRYKVAYGGRGSSKSWTVARILLLMSMNKPLRILCTREIQDSIKDSVHKLLSDQIDLLGLTGFTVQNDVIRHSNGSEFLFKGLYTNLSKIKSFEGVDICWIEEAESISARSWEILDPTIRKPGSEIWITFNPRYEDDAIYNKFVGGENIPDNALIVKVNWQDNKHFPLVLQKQKDHMARTDPDLYLHIWEGELKKNTAEQIFHSKWIIEDFESNPRIEHYHFGADWGFSQDPNTVNRVHVAAHEKYGPNCLYIEYEANDRPYDEDERNTSSDLDQLPDLWEDVPGITRYEIFADSARPETVSYMNGKGFNVSSVSKWPGSIEDGISYIRAFDKVIIHSRCKNTIWEFKSYKYKVDSKSGQITNKIIDKFNHHIDAIRYALSLMIKGEIVDYSKIV
ncbi:PBSX family phage terminase large subunit [Sulfurimonas sp.]|uniref:PBSX family phage terminase large subunit n=1 Tax=Sulfurimonas sp. TaxID=2022749 RepID=UPI0035645769